MTKMTSDENFTARRAAFKERFYKFAQENGVKVCAEWGVSLPDFLPIMIKLYDANSKRIFTVEYFDDDQTPFEYAIRKTGIDFEENDLLFRCRNCEENVSMILDIYALWFIDGLSTEEMERALAAKLLSRPPSN
jgi:hypothetical protein